MAIYITGDTHREFERIFEFAEENGTTEEDILIILGDSGINYLGDINDRQLKRELSQLPLTLLCIKGNHDRPVEELDEYEEIEWNDGTVYRENDFPNLLFAKDGSVYTLQRKKAIVIGGAYSVDKYYRLYHGLPWFPDEQPSDEIKDYVESQLDKCGWKVDCVLSHTVPISYEPVWAFIPGIDQSSIDKSTERWLQEIEDKLTYDEWYAGHYHVDSQEGPIRIMFEDYEEL